MDLRHDEVKVYQTRIYQSPSIGIQGYLKDIQVANEKISPISAQHDHVPVSAPIREEYPIPGNYTVSQSRSIEWSRFLQDQAH